MQFTRKLGVLLLVFSVLASMFTLSVQANEQPIRVYMNNVRVDFPDQNPIIVEERTLVPVRGVFEQAGFSIEWFEDVQMVRMTSGDTEVLLQIGFPQFSINGEMIDLDVPAQIIGQRTMLPLRAISEAIGMEVEWDGVNRIVRLFTPEFERPESTITLNKQSSSLLSLDRATVSTDVLTRDQFIRRFTEGFDRTVLVVYRNGIYRLGEFFDKYAGRTFDENFGVDGTTMTILLADPGTR